MPFPLSSPDAETEDPRGYVYLLGHKSPECEKISFSRYKIGKSATPYTRFRQLKSALPGYTALLHLIETDDMKRAEDFLHDTYEQKRLPGGGEWFKLAPKDVLTILGISKIRYARASGDDIIHYDPRPIDKYINGFGEGDLFERWLKEES